MIKAVIGRDGTHVVRTLPSGQLAQISWIPRTVADGFEEYEPSRLTIAKPGVDIVTCPEFVAQLVRGEVEILVTVYSDRIGEVEDLMLAKSCTAPYFKRGFEVRSMWLAEGDEF